MIVARNRIDDHVVALVVVAVGKRSYHMMEGRHRIDVKCVD